MDVNALLPRFSRAQYTGMRVVLASLALLLAAHWYSRNAVAQLMPLLSQALSYVADDFKVVRFVFVEERGSQAIAALVKLQHALLLGGRVILPIDSSEMVVIPFLNHS